MAVMLAHVPKIRKILKMFDPIILPITSSDCFLDAATIAVTSSGSDVPKAIINKEIKA